MLIHVVKVDGKVFKCVSFGEEKYRGDGGRQREIYTIRDLDGGVRGYVARSYGYRAHTDYGFFDISKSERTILLGDNQTMAQSVAKLLNTSPYQVGRTS
jgi:hypothetical protein